MDVDRIVGLLIEHRSEIGIMANNGVTTDLAAIANDLIYWYGKSYMHGTDYEAWSLCIEKYNELANNLGWETV